MLSSKSVLLGALGYVASARAQNPDSYGNASATFASQKGLITSCPLNCTRYAVASSTKYWSPIDFVTTITHATVIAMIDAQNQTSYSTEFNTDLAGYTLPETNAEGTHIATAVSFDSIRSTDVTTTVVYPTATIDYNDYVDFYGQLPVSGQGSPQCVTGKGLDPFSSSLPSHPSIPQAVATVDPSDTLGLRYSYVVASYDSFVDVTTLFPGFAPFSCSATDLEAAPGVEAVPAAAFVTHTTTSRINGVMAGAQAPQGPQQGAAAPTPGPPPSNPIAVPQLPNNPNPGVETPPNTPPSGNAIPPEVAPRPSNTDTQPPPVAGALGLAPPSEHVAPPAQPGPPPAQPGIIAPQQPPPSSENTTPQQQGASGPQEQGSTGSQPPPVNVAPAAPGGQANPAPGPSGAANAAPPAPAPAPASPNALAGLIAAGFGIQEAPPANNAAGAPAPASAPAPPAPPAIGAAPDSNSNPPPQQQSPGQPPAQAPGQPPPHLPPNAAIAPLASSPGVSAPPAPQFINNDLTLQPGQATAVVAGTTQTLPPGSGLTIGSAVLSYAAPTASAPGSVEITQNAQGAYVVGSRTLTLGAVATVSGTVVSLPSSGEPAAATTPQSLDVSASGTSTFSGTISSGNGSGVAYTPAMSVTPAGTASASASVVATAGAMPLLVVGWRGVWLGALAAGWVVW